jgi:hypothetical protein
MLAVSCGGRDYASRTIFHYNKQTQIGRFEYISQGFGGGERGFEFYRGYINENLSRAWMVGIYGGESALGWTNYLAFTASGIREGTFSNTTSVSLFYFCQCVESLTPLQDEVSPKILDRPQLIEDD